MSDVWLNIVMVVVFVLIGGFFSGTELALISLRESQVRTLSEQGRRGAALGKLLADPNRFLATVQIGVTLATLSASAFGAETLNKPFSAALVGWGVSPGLAGPLAFIVRHRRGISYLSLVLGELTPKRLALQRAEGLAMLVAPSLNRLATPVPADRLGAVDVDERAGPAASAATRRSAARRSARRSCATWWPRTSR